MAKKKEYLREGVEKITSIREMVELAVFEAGDKIAYKYKKDDNVVEVTYSEFANTFTHLGAFLNSLDLDSKTVSCVGPNSYKWIVSYFSMLRSSGIFVPLDKDLPENDFIYLLNDCMASAVFCSEKAEKVIAQHIDELPHIKAVICFEREEDDGIFYSFDKAIEKGAELSAAAYLQHSDKVDKLKMIVYTSGTTGRAKGVMLSEKNLISDAYYGLQVANIGKCGLSVLPWHHTYEAVTGIFVAFHSHATLCINENMMALLKNLSIYKPDYIFVVPALVEIVYNRIIRGFEAKGMLEELQKAIVKSKGLLKVGVDIRPEAFKSIHEMLGGNLKLIVCGGAPLREEVGEFFNDIGIDCINGYGITECSPLVSVNIPEYNNDSSTVGYPLPCCDVKIDEPNEEGIGEICVKGDIVMMGYYKQPEATDKVLKDGWFSTGDYGYINKKGQIVISGRKKNIIVLNNGKNVYPEEIESYIQGIDYVNEVVVNGDLNEYGEENSLVAEVYLNEVKTSTEVLKAIKKACQNLPGYKQISRVEIRDEEFEKTTSNKIKRNSAKTARKEAKMKKKESK
jgi:long-chain acyl-CoA synthetase